MTTPRRPDRRTIQLTPAVYERLTDLARAWQAEERLTRQPSYDDVIRRLLAARDTLADFRGREM